MDYSSHICERRQHELTQKYVKLKVLEDLLKTNKLKIQEKKNTLKVNNAELDELHEKVWSLESKMCDDVWDFSRKHNFEIIVDNYPDVPWNFSLECDCEGKSAEKSKETAEDCQESRLLSVEIENLKNELEVNKSYGLKKDLIQFKRELREAEEGTPEMQRLRKEIDECKERIVNLRELKGTKSNYDYDFFSNMLPEDNDTSRISPASNNRSEKIMNSCIFNSRQTETTKNNSSKFKQKFPQMKATKMISDGSHNFIKASDLMNNENRGELHNKEQLPIESCSSVLTKNQAKKKFVLKQQSAITKRQR